MVKGPEGSDPASVAFEAVAAGIEGGATACSSILLDGFTPKLVSWMSLAK